MHLVDEQDQIALTSVDELRAYFAAGNKPREQWRIGTEHELIGVVRAGRPPAHAPGYDGAGGIGALLRYFSERGWSPVVEHERIIALSKGSSQITIEPGGQFELAGPPVARDQEFVGVLGAYLEQLRAASGELGVAWLRAGIRPWGQRDDIPWMPKSRYDVMRAYMPKVGTRGLDMMLRTATVQVNLDYSDEADAAAKMKVAQGLAPLLTALYANSSVVDGKDSGFASYRAHIWRDTDRARCGLLPFVFERNDLFAAYTEWALDVPMYFVYRGGYRAVDGLTFRRFLREGHQGERATRADWALHLSTLFPETRLKTYLEIRSCDCGSLPMITALAPLCRGFLYDAAAREASWELVAHLSLAQRETLIDEAARRGLQAEVPGRGGRPGTTVGELAKELVGIAKQGLARLQPDAVGLLWPVDAIARSGTTQADSMRAIFAAGGSLADLVRKLEHPELAAR